MNTTNHCRVYVHPAALTSPASITKIQKATGLTAIAYGSIVILKGVAA